MHRTERPSDASQDDKDEDSDQFYTTTAINSYKCGRTASGTTCFPSRKAEGCRRQNLFDVAIRSRDGRDHTARETRCGILLKFT
ncbi:hypothetical protein BaRGS_00036763 [Batillaria attramentaria]|uniref:Uncharacterized protein n=1 Tax=Batillaria attramentaria TaxID=370345 RepID=A0ABD0JB39_9CAEN